MPANDTTLPFAHLNLRRNPFGATDIESWAKWAVVDLGDIPERLQRPGFVAQVLGPRGHGKTTHLMSIKAQLPEGVPYIHLREGEKPPPLPDVPLIIVDETQRLPRRQRRRLFRPDRACAIGSHEDHTDELNRAGVAHVTIQAKGLSPSDLQAAVNKRIAAARRGKGDIPTLSRETANHLVERFGGDVRRIESQLYEMIQRFEGPADARL